MDLPHSDGRFAGLSGGDDGGVLRRTCGGLRAVLGGVPASILYDNTKLAVARILATAHGNGRACSANCNVSPIRRSLPTRQGQRMRRVEVWSGWSGGTTRCRFRMRREFAALNEQLLVDAADARRSAARRRDDRAAGAGPGVLPRPAGVAPRRLREAGGPGQLAVAGALSQHRLLGADRLRPSRGSDPRLRRQRGDLQAPTSSPLQRAPYEREDFVFDPLHGLALLERKIGALDQAAPLAGWDLPEAFTMLRRLLEARMAKQGKREFVQVLRLLEVFEIEDVAAGVRDVIERGVIGFDAVKHLVLCRIERRPSRLMARQCILTRRAPASRSPRPGPTWICSMGRRHDRHTVLLAPPEGAVANLPA